MWQRVGLVFIFAFLTIGTARAACPPADDQPLPPWQDQTDNPPLLLSTYKCVSAAYASSKSIDIFNDIQMPLAGAGIYRLFYSNDGLTLSQRVRILNDYGFWLYKENAFPLEAVSALTTVVQLAPDRAIAWMNLGDLYRQMGSPDFIIQAIYAYHRYTLLTKNPDQHVSAFLAANPYNPNLADAFRFIAKAAEAGKLQSLFIPDGTPVDLLGDGTKYYVYTVFQGTMDVPSIFATTSPQKDPYSYNEDSESQEVDFSPLGQLDGVQGALEGVAPGDQLKLFLFNKRYYILDETWSNANNAADEGTSNYDPPMAAAQVVVPNHGVICHIVPLIHPRLALGQAEPICDKFLKGSPFEQPAQDTSLAGTVIAPGRGGQYVLSATATVDLEDDCHSQMVAYESIDSSAGAGCSQAGLMLFDPTTQLASTGDLNDAIQSIPLGCGEAREFLVLFDGKVYIETTHGHDVQPGEADGAGLYEVRNDNVFPVCLITNDFTYEAQ